MGSSILIRSVAPRAALGVGAVSAADLAVKAPIAPVVAPAYSWAGFYIGGNAGYSWGRAASNLNADPVTISNMGYFGYPRNSGFILMPSDLIAYRQGARAFEYKNTNGLLTTLDMNARDFAK